MTPPGAHGAALDFPTEVDETGDDGVDNESDDDNVSEDDDLAHSYGSRWAIPQVIRNNVFF